MRTSFLARLVGAGVISLTASSLQAQQPAAAATAAAPTPKAFSFGFAATSMSIVPAAANIAAVHNQTVGLQLDAGYLFHHLFYVGADLAPQFLSDHAGFTQATTGGDKSSTASLIYFSAMAGPRTPAFPVIPGRWQGSFSLLGGVSATTGKRSIDNCVDCSESSIDIPGGAFVQPTLLVGGEGARLRLAQRQYLTGDGIRFVSSLGVELGGR